MKLKIKKGDMVQVQAGKDKGKKGKVLSVFPSAARLVVEGVNIRTKHVKARRQGEKGQSVQIPVSLHISNVQLVCPKCSKLTRIGYLEQGETKVRICKKCNAPV